MLRLVVSMVVVATCLVLPTGSWGTEIVSAPIVRDVLLNLSIDDLKTATPVQLKRQSDGVLAQGVRSLPEALQFEVVIKGAHADIPVYFPVPKESAVCKAYEQFIQTDPSKVLATLGGVKMPIAFSVSPPRPMTIGRWDALATRICASILTRLSP